MIECIKKRVAVDKQCLLTLFSRSLRKKSPHFFGGHTAFALLGLLVANQLAFAQTITNAPATPTWNTLVTDPLLIPGISAATVGVISPTSPFIPTPPYLGAADGDHVLKLYNTSNIAYPTPPATGRPTVTPDEHHHHHWDMGSMGNIYGVAIDDERNLYTTASTHYGAGYFNGAGVVGFGGIGDGQTPDTAATDNNTRVLASNAAAGAVYKVDAITGNVSVLASLPQQAFSFTHENCENAAETLARNTGPALGNVEYDAINNQLFVSNFEDGRIYRLSMAGVVLSVFDPFTIDNGAAGLPVDAMPYGLAVNTNSSKLYFGTLDFANPTNPGLYAVELSATGDFTGAEVDQNADLTNDLNYSQIIGGGFTSNPWASYSDLTFTPKGELMIGVRTGCGSTAPNLATSHNHGGSFYKLVQDGAGLYNAAAPGTVGADGNFPVHYIGDTLGPDDGYGGVAVFDKGDGTYDYLTTSADIGVEEGPHGFLVFPHDYTVGDNVSTYFIAQGASIAGLPSTNPPAGVSDYKGVFGDIEVLGTLLDWGDAPDSYNTDNIPPDPSDANDLAGPAHILTAENITIGSVVDFEASGIPSANADGDDSSGSTPDDEDGITGTTAFIGGDTALFNVPVNNPAGNPDVTLYAWLDLNGDGDFADPGEFVASSAIAAGTSPTVNLNFGTVPNNDADSFIRLRITSDTLTATDYEGYASNGEVEDHPVTLTALMSLGSTVWLDTNVNGVQDIAEPAIVGVSVILLNADGTTYDSDPNVAGVQALTTVTDASGQYNFNDLPQGDYRVQIDLATASSHTASLLVPTPIQVADPDAAGTGQDNNTDSNIDASVPGSSVGTNAGDTAIDDKYTSGVITLSDNDEPTGETDPIGVAGVDQPNQSLTVSDDPDNDGNMTVDFGFIPPVSLGSTLWLDTDRDGQQDLNEAAIVGATVMLLNADGTLYDSDLVTAGIQSLSVNTDANGQYNFDQLRVGDYRVKVDVSAATIGTATNAVKLLPSPVQVADPDAPGAGLNNNTDSNIDLAVAGTAVGTAAGDTGVDDIYTSGVISLSSGGEPTSETNSIIAGNDQPNQNATVDPDSSGNMTVDFGFVQAVSLGSTIWFDNDADGMQDATEPGIANATVTLLNGDGTVYDSDPATAGIQALTDTTDADGQYNFDGLPEADYRVQVNLTAATAYTAGTLVPTPIQVADPDAAGAGQNNNTDSNVDSAAPGHNPAANTFQTGIVTLTVGDEPTGEVDPIGTPGADQPNQGTDDPDANGNMTVDMGFIQVVSLGSTVWQDSDADGTQDVAEPAIAGATVTLLNANGTVYDSDLMTAGVQALVDVTDGDGQYNFNDLLPGDYRVQIDLGTVVNGSDLLPTPIQVADPDALGAGLNNNTDSNIDLAFDVNPADLIHTTGIVSLTPGLEPTGETDPIGAGGADQPNQGLTPTSQPDNAGNMTVDVGFVKSVSLGSTIWKDNDVDGIQDAAEPGIVGATVTLLNADGTTYDSNPYLAGVQALTDTTDADGQYNFNDLVPGDYRVKVDLATATNTNAVAFIPSLVQVPDPDAAGPGQDNNTDSNVDVVFDTVDTDQMHFSGVITLSAGGEPTGETDPIGAGANPSTPDQPNQGLSAVNDPDNSGNMTVDMGFFEPVSLGSTVWFDNDSDGVQDVTEPAIVGVTATLLNDDGTVYDSDPVTTGVQALTDVTDADGQYNFNGLPADDYRVQIDLNTATSHTGGALEPTPVQVSDPDAAGAGQDNNTDSNVDTAAPGHNPAGNIYQSGVVTLSIAGEPSNEVDPIGTGADVTTPDQPNQNAAQPDTNGNMTVDFGFIAPVSLGSTIWEDRDADGTQDAAEPAIIGATVTLLNADGTVFDSDPNITGVQALTDITDADGQYNFDGIIPGDYRVQVDLSTVTGGESYIPSPAQVADPDAAGPGQDNNTDSNVDTAFDSNVNDLIHTSGVVTLTVGGEPTGETDPIGAGGADQPNQGLTATDDPDNAGNMTVDMGFIKPVSLGSTAWLDSDEDGVQDAAEPGIVGATVTLLNANGTVFDNDPSTAGVQALTDVSDADGQYNFNDIPEGDYRVQIDLSTATNANAATFIPSPAQIADPDAAGAGQDNNSDSNIDEAFDPNTADQLHTSGVITLSVGGEPTGETDPIGTGAVVTTPDQPNQALTVANQPDANGNMTVDFGFIEPVSLGSTVWLDSDADGVQDSLEPLIVGATVTLLNTDGSVYDSDPVATGVQSVSDVTDASGLYNFNDLPEGDYRVQVDLNTATSHTGGYLDPTPTQVADPDAAGAGQDNNTDSNVDDAAPGHNPAGNIYQSGVVTLSVAGEPTGEADVLNGGSDQPNQATAQPDASGNMTVDFGFIQPVSLGSTIWQDLNGNGTQDAAEPGIVGATITLLNADGSVFDSDPNTAGVQALTDSTDTDGQYNFDGLPPGDYRVQVDLSTVTNGSDLFVSPTQVADPDAAGPGQDNNTDSNVDLAFDTNLNDQVHTSGVVTLSAGLEPTGETDPIGAGANSSTPDQPNQGLTSTDDPDNSGNMTVDMAFVKPVSIGSTIWEDSNGDGVQDDNELTIEGATVTLLNADGSVFDSDPYTTGVQALTDATDAEGQYNFNALPPGDYRVQVDVSTVSGGANFVPSLNQVADPDAAGVGQDNNTDSNIDLAFDTNLTDSIHTSGIVTLSAGDEPTGETDPIDAVDNNGAVTDQPNQTATNPDDSGNMTVDFGFIATVSLGSIIWDDLNGDGLQTNNEPPLAGATVALLMADTNPLSITFGQFIAATDVLNTSISSILTTLDGTYLFDNLRPGDYKVQVTPPADYTPTLVQNPTDDALENDSNANLAATGADNVAGLAGGTVESVVITLESGKEAVESDAARGDNQDGINASPADESGNMTVDFGFIKPASVGNYVWLDFDGDGVQDANEDGIAGVTVTLTPPAGVDAGAGPGNPVQAVTGPNGEYLFTDLPPFVDVDPALGYVVSVDPASLPPALVQTYDEGQTGVIGVLDHTSDPIQLSPQEEHLTADFGYNAPPGSIGDTIWVDADEDGIQDPGEPGIPNVPVYLVSDIDGNGVADTSAMLTTDEQGKYLFTGLPAGVYVVVVNPPDTSSPQAILNAGDVPLPGYVAHPNSDPDVRDGNSATPDNQTIVVLVTEPGGVSSNLDADFGYSPPIEQNNTIGDTVWLDVDEDGNGPPVGTNANVAGDGSDSDELPIANVTVSLYQDTNGNGAIDSGEPVIATTITGNEGDYLFSGIPDGDYIVQITDQNNVLDGFNQTYDNNGLGTPNQSVVDDLGVGVSTPDANLDQDFGYADTGSSIGLGVIGDTVFFDQNNNGSPDAEEGIEGVIVQLYAPGPDGDINTKADNILVGSTTTDENGVYLFTGLDISDTGTNPGTDYQVVVVTDSLPNSGSGWVNSVDPDTVNPGDSMSVTTISAATPQDLDQDFGYIGDGDNSLQGTVWSDTDGGGVQDETGTFAEVTVELRDPEGNVIQTTTTDANGDYSFVALPDGIYVVVVTDENNVLASFEHTDSPNGVSDTSDQTSKDDTGYTVDLDSGSTNPAPVLDITSDFGYMPVVTNPISLGSFHAQRSGANVALTWTTQTEVGNIGFHVYALQNGEWLRLNAALIASQGDSIAVQHYVLNVSVFSQYYAIADIDLYGNETLHGPFKLGVLHGVEEQRKPIAWGVDSAASASAGSAIEATVNSTVLPKAVNDAVGLDALPNATPSTDALRRQQLEQRNALRRQKRANGS